MMSTNKDSSFPKVMFHLLYDRSEDQGTLGILR